MLWMDLEETNKPMSSAHRVSVNSRGPRTKPCEYWWQKARGEVLVLLTQGRVFFIVLCVSNRGVVRMMKEMKLSCCNCHFEFFYHSGKWWRRTPTRPFWYPFSHPQWQLDLTNEMRLYSPFSHIPQYTLFAPETFCLRIVFNFFWGDCNTQEKLNKSSAKFWGTNKVYYKICANSECCFRQAESLFTLLLNRPQS